MELIGEKIKRIRNEKRLSKKEVAEICGLSASSYLYIEEGKTKSISIEVGKGIAKALEVPFDELFEIENNQSQSKFSEQEFNTLLEALENAKSLINKLIAEKEKINDMQLADYIGFTTKEFNYNLIILELLPVTLRDGYIKDCVFELESKRDALKKDINEGHFTEEKYETMVKWFYRNISTYPVDNNGRIRGLIKPFSLLSIQNFEQLFLDCLKLRGL